MNTAPVAGAGRVLFLGHRHIAHGFHDLYTAVFLGAVQLTEFIVVCRCIIRLAEGEIRTHAPPRTIAFLLRLNKTDYKLLLRASSSWATLAHGARGWIRTNIYGFCRPNN